MNLYDIIILQEKLRTIYQKYRDTDVLDALILVGKIRREIEEKTPIINYELTRISKTNR